MNDSTTFEPVDFPVVDGRSRTTDIPIMDARGQTLVQLRVTADDRPQHRAVMIGVVSPEGFAYHVSEMRGHGHNPRMLTYLDRVADFLLRPQWARSVDVNPQHVARAPMDALSSNVMLVDCHGYDEAAMWRLKAAIVQALKTDASHFCAEYEQLYGKREHPEDRARLKAEAIMALDPVSDMKHLTVEALAGHFASARHLGGTDKDKHVQAAQRFIMDGGRYVQGEPEISKPQFVGDTEIKYPRTIKAREIIADASLDFSRAEAALVTGRGRQ